MIQSSVFLVRCSLTPTPTPPFRASHPIITRLGVTSITLERLGKSVDDIHHVDDFVKLFKDLNVVWKRTTSSYLFLTCFVCYIYR